MQNIVWVLGFSCFLVLWYARLGVEGRKGGKHGHAPLEARKDTCKDDLVRQDVVVGLLHGPVLVKAVLLVVLPVLKVARGVAVVQTQLGGRTVDGALWERRAVHVLVRLLAPIGVVPRAEVHVARVDVHAAVPIAHLLELLGVDQKDHLLVVLAALTTCLVGARNGLVVGTLGLRSTLGPVGVKACDLRICGRRSGRKDARVLFVGGHRKERKDVLKGVHLRLRMVVQSILTIRIQETRHSRKTLFNFFQDNYLLATDNYLK